MDLSTSYLGLKLSNPFVVGASPFCDNLSRCQELYDAGASAIVMHSFFEEQIEAESNAPFASRNQDDDNDSPPSDNLPDYTDYHLNPEHYLRQLDRLRKLVDIPIIASLNGTRLGGWVNYAQRMEDAGASAIELNLYQLAADPGIPGDEIEADMLQVVRTVTASVEIPVAVKLLPFHSALAHFAARLNENGAAGVTLFNRLHQSDIDLVNMEKVSHLRLSDSTDLLLRLRWLSILSPDFPGSLACSGGVHTAADAAKALLVGADVVQVTSALLKHGPSRLKQMINGLEAWMQSTDYGRIADFHGMMNHHRSGDAGRSERADYLNILQTWRV
jgi:dihydroorotate dehydrogenase (fumarate)